MPLRTKLIRSLEHDDSPVFPLAGFDAWFDDRIASHRFRTLKAEIRKVES